MAIVVVTIHVFAKYNYMTLAICRPFMNVAVAGFVFLSGYLTNTSVKAKELYKRRICIVLLPYIIFTFFYTIISSYKLGLETIPTRLMKNILTTQGNGILYYLIVYIQLVLLTPLLVRIAKQKKWLLNLPILLLQPLFLVCFYLGVVNGDIIKEAPWYTMFFPVWLSYYYLGILIGNNILKTRINNSILIILAASGVLLQIAEGIFWINNTTVKDMYFSQIRITAFLENIPLLLLITKYIRSEHNKNNKLLCKIGDASFGIYLLHPAFIMVCDMIIPRSEITFIFTFVFAFAGSFAAILILNKIFPKKILKYAGLALK